MRRLCLAAISLIALSALVEPDTLGAHERPRDSHARDSVPEQVAPATPTGLSVSSTTASGASLDWDDVTGATAYAYRHKVSTDSTWETAVEVTTSDATISGLANGTTYDFAVLARNTGGDSAWSDTAQGTTNPATPTGLSVSSTTASGASLDWDDVTGATAYAYRHKVSTDSTWETAVEVTTSDATISGLANGTTYDFAVLARNTGGDSAWSDTAQGTTNPATPTGLSVSSTTASGASLDWDDVTGATAYAYRHKVSTDSTWETAVEVTTSDATISGLANGTTYDFAVLARNTGGDSAWSDTAQGTTNPATPTGLSVSSTTASGASLDWDDVTGATAYAYRHKVSTDSTWETAVEVTTSDATISGLANGTTYDFAVLARNTGGDSAWSDTTQGTTNPATPESSVAVAATSSAIVFDWADSHGATTYAYQHRVNGSQNWGTEQTVAASSVTVTGLSSGTEYDFRVRARNAGGDSEWPAPIRGLTSPGVPTNLSAPTVEYNSIVLDWDDTKGATAYEFQTKPRSHGNWTSFHPVRQAAASTAVVGGLDDLTAYDFRVRAKNASGEGEWAEVSATTIEEPPLPPQQVEVSLVSSTTLTFEWVGDRATSYGYQYREEGTEEWSEEKDVSESRVTITGLTTDQEYEFRVRAKNSGGASSYCEPIVRATPTLGPPPVPSGLSVTSVDETEITLDWDDTPDADAYNYQYGVATAQEWASAVEITESTVTINSLEQDNEYRFRVSAKNSEGESAYTEPIFETARFVSPFTQGRGLWGTFRDDPDDPHFWKGDTAWVIASLIFGAILAASRKSPTFGFGGAVVVLAAGALLTQTITPLTLFFFVLAGIGFGFSAFILSRG